MDLKTQLEEFEGRRNAAYPDPLTGGKPFTIGIGHAGPDVSPNLVWSDERIDEAFALDVKVATEECERNFPWFSHLNEPRKAVLVNMVFQMGIKGVNKFTNTLANIRDERWANAAEHMRQSLWADQTPKRANRLAHQMETGEWN